MTPKEGDPHPIHEGVVRIPNSRETLHIKAGEDNCIGCPVVALPDDPDLDCGDCGEGFVWFGEHMRVISLLRRDPE